VGAIASMHNHTCRDVPRTSKQGWTVRSAAALEACMHGQTLAGLQHGSAPIDAARCCCCCCCCCCRVLRVPSASAHLFRLDLRLLWQHPLLSLKVHGVRVNIGRINGPAAAAAAEAAAPHEDMPYTRTRQLLLLLQTTHARTYRCRHKHASAHRLLLIIGCAEYDPTATAPTRQALDRQGCQASHDSSKRVCLSHKTHLLLTARELRRSCRPESPPASHSMYLQQQQHTNQPRQVQPN
jgi:hypothetical protein